MIELRDFGWRYAGRAAWALRHVDLHIDQGERVLLLGPSGAGKSTLLAAIAGLLPAESGEYEGWVSTGPPSARLGRSGVAMVFQDPQSQLVMARVGDDVAFGLENYGVLAHQIWPRVAAALADVGFAYPLDRSTAALSGGEQQRLVLAGALALRPSVLLLDEPTANLDPAGAALIRGALTNALGDRTDTALIMVEHYVEQSLALVDRVVVLTPGGGIAADGPPEEVFATHGDRLAAQGVWVPGHPIAPRPAMGAPGPALIQAEDVAIPHRLSTIDMVASAGHTLAVQGPNGSGKSTLALVLGGLLAPEQGQVRATAALAGTAAGKAPHRWRAATLTRHIGSVFQNPQHQFLTSRVWDELALGPRRVGMSTNAIRSRVDDLLDRLRLGHLAAANPYTLSAGEQRRLSVATALATTPRLIILDEPTFGQDRRTWIELVDLMAERRDDGCSLVIMTHDQQLVDSLATTSRILWGPGAPDPTKFKVL